MESFEVRTCQDNSVDKQDEETMGVKTFEIATFPLQARAF